VHPALLDAALHPAALVDGLIQDAGLERDGGTSRDGVRLPFSLRDIRLGATGASSLRVRLSTKHNDDDDGSDGGGLSLLAVDETGRLAVSVGGLFTRPVDPGQLEGIRGNDQHRDSLFSIEWTPLPTAPIPDGQASTPDQWALLGNSSIAQTLAGVGVFVGVHGDLASVAGVVGGVVPGVVVLDVRGLVDGGLVAGDGLPGCVQGAVCGVLRVLQGWLSDERFSSSRLVVLTCGAVAARFGDGVDGLVGGGVGGLIDASVWGLVRSAQSEHPGRFVLIDLDGQDVAASVLCDALSSGETQLAIRGNELFTPRLTRSAIPDGKGQTGDEDRDVQVGDRDVSTQDGSVLITGGTGGLGALLATHLVTEHGVASLILASRRGLDAPGAAELQRELEQLGSRVLVVACDVSDREALRGLLEQVPAEFPLRGVVHAAGALDDGVIGSLTSERVERVFAPKVDAAWHLHELTGHMDLSMFVLFSSAAATMGSPGQGNYAAANAFLDALAAHRRAHHLPGISIAWGYWEQASEMTSALSESDLARMTRQGVLPLSTRLGLELFDAALEADQPQVAGMRLDTVAARAQARAGLLPDLLRGLVRVPAVSSTHTGSLVRRLAGVPKAEREAVVLDLVRVEVAAVLGHASHGGIDPERAFKDLGFDSLVAVELRNRLSAITGLRLPATLVFDYPNATALARYLLDQVGEDGASGAASVDGELDKLERLLSLTDADHSERTRIAARLQTFLAALDDPDVDGSVAANDDDEFESATDDELFELIDKELGA
jgi:NAD(P)-dependent dehydrogenase (short-subunit alcohol dehydrogenase family)/acyl carrier protein